MNENVESNPILWEAKCKVCGASSENDFSWNGECLRCEAGNGDEELFDTCTDCPHQDACWDYVCGKECGVVDAEGNEI